MRLSRLTGLSAKPVTPISNFNPAAPADLQRIVRRCLAKDPDERYQTIKDVAIELKELRRELEGRADADTSASPSTGTSPQVVQSQAPGGSTTASLGSLATPSASAEYLVNAIKQHKVAGLLTLVVLVAGITALVAYLRAPSSAVALRTVRPAR
jgi:serine/threonine protein kinase